ncbi:zf-HC2 domain-containing protein [Peribacillus glennii]|uniref:Anti-sigma-W factor RsiW n=1 Tax=Peribacillus glennii TaxID=2303991 RepID=A0A372L930_9BACI|nr:zf-HC2 domain-containing protein [Peribacillus glennii]RFU61022.1 anti-sigma factor [Peribacillus glennii]
MKCRDEIIGLMHEYLDEDITKEDESFLRGHLRSCEDCRAHFHELEKTVVLVQSSSRIVASPDFTQKVMSSLPKEKKKVGAERWLKNHPLLTAVSLFLVLMAGTLFGTYNQDEQFSVSKQPNLMVENEMVVVPSGETVNGDVVVQNGDIRIEGKVNGNVTVINGHNYLASAGSVTGEIEEIDQIFEWLWFKIKNTGKAIFQINEQK